MSAGVTPSTRITAVILAGGASRRMGTDKSLLPIEGKPLIEHIASQLAPRFARVCISANEPHKYAFLGLPIIPDAVPNEGPLMALASVLRAVDTPQVFVMACDMPVVPVHALERLLELAEEDPCVAARSGGGLDPLFAVYARQQLALLEGLLAEGKRRMYDLLEADPPVVLELEERLPNLNRPEDYARFVG
ncbi:MAG: molybdenum cofactor guanylyltransferase [Candidatus Hydrogenedentes bacterium]|nr:molybdenum cofactor guanylyltransferase [Candidatus Hydrogenedentota bacterium]